MEKEKRLLFNRVVEQKLGEAVQSTDVGEGYEMPTYELYVVTILQYTTLILRK